MNKQLQLKKLLLFAAFLVAFAGSRTAFAQVYLQENFDSAFVGNPGAPPNWSQVRLGIYGNIAPDALTASPGNRDWMQNVNTGSTGVWSLVGPFAGTVPNATTSGNGVLWIDDYNVGTYANFNVRRMITPTVNLSFSSTPYVKFKYFNANTSSNAYPLRVMASKDNGVTWNAIQFIQPNFNLVTGTAATGATPWRDVIVKVPAAYKVSNAKFAIENTNSQTFSSSIFIDNFSIEEFTPTTIFSNGTGGGLWMSTSTWTGGVIPTALNHVVISSTDSVFMNGNIVNAQDVTVSGKLAYNSTSTTELAQFFGSLNITTGGKYFSMFGFPWTTTATTKATYIGGHFANNGTVAFTNASTANAALLMYGGDSAAISGTGTVFNGYMGTITHGNSGGIRYYTPITIRGNCNLFEGNVNPNGNLTIGVAGVTHAIQRSSRSAFTNYPIYPVMTSTFQRNVSYVTFAGQVLTQNTFNTGFEVDTTAGVRFIAGTLTMSTQDMVRLTFPVLVGDPTNTRGGALSFARGILLTDSVNILTVNTLGTGTAGGTPSTTAPVNTQGSYIVGPVRFNRPSTGTAAVTVPVGVGTAYCGFNPSSNQLKYLTLNPGGNWNSQNLTFSMPGVASGAVDTGLTATMGAQTYRIQLNGGNDLPTTATLQASVMNYTFGNSDNLFGNQNQLFIAQATSRTAGLWKKRSLASATTTGFVDNSQVFYTTATTAPGPIAPIATQGEYFTFASNAALVTYASGSIQRTTSPTTISSSNNVMLRVAVNANGTIPRVMSQVTLNTAGTTRLAAIASAQVFYTGTDSTYTNPVQYGSTVTSPSGSYVVTGSQLIRPGLNYLWVVYNVSASAVLGDSLSAQFTSLKIDTATSTLIAPAAGYRVVSAPMTYVSSSATQSVFSGIAQGNSNNQIMDIQVVMSATGAPIAFTSASFATTGSNNPTADITNAKLYYGGTSSTFSTATLVGTATAPNGSFVINGNANLANGTNYFWLTYDVPTGAVIGDSVDATIASITVGGTVRTLVANPAGNRKVIAPYCISKATSTGDEELWGVQFGSLNSVSTCTTVACGPGSANQLYSNYSGCLAAPNIVQGLSTPINITLGTCGSFYGENLAVYIDYNQDGIFQTNETAATWALQTGSANAVRTANITVPCTASTGITRMRVVYAEQAAAAACGTYTWGETEDYDINIVGGAPTYISSTVSRPTGIVSPGATDVPILRVPIKVSATPCNPGVITNMRFNAIGTTLTSNITQAKLYKTGSSNVFSTANLLGTAFPSGTNQFVFNFNDTAINDTNNYWLAYDISASAANGNLIAGRVDSFNVFGNNYIPTNNNPTGNRVVTAPMTYLGSTTIHPDLSKVETGTNNNIMMRIMVRTSSTGAPITATSFTLNTNGGGNDTSNISAIKIWYTGPSATFAATTQFGSTYVPTLPGATYSVTGSQPLNTDTNYFWVTYNIKPTGNAILGDSVDGEFSSVTIAGIPRFPAVSAPAGNRIIRAPYCTSAPITSIYEHIGNVTLTTGSNTWLNDGPGCTPSLSNTNAVGAYTDKTGLTPAVLPKGLPINFSVCQIDFQAFYYGCTLGIFIDYNQDGVFQTNEYVYTSPAYSTQGVPFTGSFTIPCTAASGNTRMRLVLNMLSTTVAPCGTYNYGHTVDYTVNLTTSPAAYLSSNAVQVTGTVGAGTPDVAILRVPVKVSATSCAPGTLTKFYFNTIGTTTVSNITAAKLYKTGSTASFSSSNLLGSVASPNGQFSFTVADTAINDTNNYWLSYDVSASAANGNLLDARVDSVQVFGAYYVPANNNPTGSRVVSIPMTYLGGDIIHPDLTMIERGANNNQILRVRVRTSSTGAPINATTFSLNTIGGGNDTANISNIKVYYTGSSATFATTNQFGTSYTPVSSGGSFSVNGTQPLNNDTNYFWVTYDVKSTAILGDSVDGQVQAITIGGIPRFPSNSSPSGARRIRAPYCASSATSTGDEEILGVSIGTMNNVSTCATVACGTGSNNQLYSNYTTCITPPNLPAGISIPLAVTIGTCGGFYGESLSAYIDYNQDGVWQTNELAYNWPTATGTANAVRSANITIPCTALPGNTRMRIVYVEGSASPACGTYTWGETEDYTVNIVNQAATYTSSSAIQITGSVGAGATDVPILRIPVKASASPCTPGLITQFRFNPIGTTVTSNITQAKLYKTGSSNVFNTTNLVGTAFPSGTNQFTFNVTDTAINDTNNYWLAYDVSAAAANGNLLDARIDSLQAFGSFYIPANNNPTGSRIISVPATYLGADAIHPDLTKVETNSTGNQMLRVMVRLSSTGAPINLTQMTLNTNGGSRDTFNISNVKVYYTGSNANFASTTQFGTTYVPVLTGGTFNVTGTQTLNNDTNYFWVTYDIKSSAYVGDSVDAEITGMVINGVTRIPTTTAPAGNRKIRAPYCASNATSTADEEIWGVQFGTLNNTSNCSSVGCGTGSLAQAYSNYSSCVAAPTIYKGSATTMNITINTCGGFYGESLSAYIDYNQDGTWQTNELAYNWPTQTGTANAVRTASITIPTTALNGNTRMRIVYVEGSASPACGTYTWGETEDYTINIQDAPINTYVWSAAGGGNYTLASNWTPARSNPLGNDKLVFNSTTPLVITNVPNESNKTITITTGTNVTFNGASGSVLTGRDSLNIGNNCFIKTATGFSIGVGSDTSNLGYFTAGTNSGIYGGLTRFMNSTNTSLSFPLRDSAGTKTRVMTVNYTTNPTVSGSLTGSYLNAAPGSLGIPYTDATAGITIKRIAREGYWGLVAGAGLTGGQFTGTFNATGTVGVNNYTGLVLSTRATFATSWLANGTHLSATGTNAAPIANRQGLTVYGQYGIGADTLVNPLPVNLLFFNARNITGDVALNWATASETNNKGFEIERSADGIKFEVIGFKQGAGNSRVTTNYTLTDASAFVKANANVLYYRLKQVDFDGTSSYSQIAIVSNEDQLSDDVKVFPNPFETNIGVSIDAANSATAVVSLMDMSGRIITAENVKVATGSNYHAISNVSNLASGVYFVKVTVNGLNKTIKVTKTN